MRIEVLKSRDIASLVEIWNRNLPVDPISAAALEARVLLDPSFREEYCLVAGEGGEGIGFVVGICGEGFHFCAERAPGAGAGTQAWILAMAVEAGHRGRGVGTALLETLEGRFREAGKREVWVASYPTAYVVPGVDEVAYAEGVAFFRARGYRVASRAVAMDASLWPLALPDGAAEKEAALAAQGIAFDTYRSRWLLPLRRFLRAQVPWDWEWLALRNLGRAHEGSFCAEQFLLAIHEGEVVGYCQYEGAHFGPFGVAQGYQGRGIGTALLARALRSMAQRGAHSAWVLWTGGRAAELYARFGFRESRRFAILHKELW